MSRQVIYLFGQSVHEGGRDDIDALNAADAAAELNGGCWTVTKNRRGETGATFLTRDGAVAFLLSAAKAA